jgi:hypothetical protein
MFIRCFFGQISLFAQAARQQIELVEYIEQNYTKREMPIPMRVGAKLFTSVGEAGHNKLNPSQSV